MRGLNSIENSRLSGLFGGAMDEALAQWTRQPEVEYRPSEMGLPTRSGHCEDEMDVPYYSANNPMGLIPRKFALGDFDK